MPSLPDPFPDPNTGNHAVDNLRTLPYGPIEDTVNMTATSCITRCQVYGYNAAGIEEGTQCCKQPPSEMLYSC